LNKVSCTFCFKKVGTKYKLNEHILKFHEKSKISCDICSKEFGLTERYNKHLKVVHKQQCNKNESSLSLKHNLGRRLNSLTKLSCSVCDQLFSDRRELKNHLETHGYVCATCSQVFISYAACDEHITQKHSNKPVQCHQCSDSFDNNINLLKHQENIHPDHVNKTLVENDVKSLLACDKCQKGFRSNSGLAKHMLTCEKSESFDKGFKCDVCSKSFQTKYDLKIHSERHSSVPNYPCSFQDCIKKFYTKTDMKRHIKVSHEGRFAGSCHICGRKFLTIDGVEWKQHMNRHSQNKSLKCPFCPKSFYSDNSLKSHVVSHMDIRPWACSLCTKTFKRLKNVKDHVKTLHGIKADQEVKSCCVRQQNEPTKAEIQVIIDKRKEEMKKIHSVIDKPNENEVHDNNETSEELELDVVEHDTYKNPPSYIHDNHVSVIQANQNINSDS